MVLRDGMWAVLFTDLVGSTAQRARLGDERADLLRRELDAVVGRALTSHPGQRVSDGGDGAMYVFDSSAAAIAAGVAIQQGIERRNRRDHEPLALRVGISAGELAVEGDGLLGMAAHEAARICALSEPGEVLVSDLARQMAGSRAPGPLVPHGTFELKGLPGPVTVWRAEWVPSHHPSEQGLPPRLLSSATWAFAGRDSEMERLSVLWREAVSGTARTAFLSGEPGIGKTRLAAELARLASDNDALVLYGACDDGIGVPYQPFVTALDDYLTRAGDVVLGRYPGDLRRLTERVTEHVPNAPRPLAAGAETEQLRLFDAVSSWLEEASRVQPVLLVVDDLHWATKATLHMVRHVLRQTGHARMLTIATYRDTDLGRRHPLSGMLGDFRRLPGVERLHVTGLDQAGVLEFLQGAAGAAVDERIGEFARVLVEETEGNPFFLGEVVRHLVDSGTLVQHDRRWTSDLPVGEIGIPQGVREVVGQRLDRLSEEANDLLAAAAVVGREFPLTLVARVSGREPNAAVDLLDEASRARLVDELGPDRFRFAHALVRATLVEELSASKRLRMHRRVAEALEDTHTDDVSALAHHWLEAAELGDPARAVDHALRAGALASEAGSCDDAVTLFRRALEVADGPDLRPQRSRLLVELATALCRLGSPDAEDVTREALAASRDVGDTRGLVRAAVLLGDHGSVTDLDTPRVLRDVLTASGDQPTPDRARLMILLAFHQRYVSQDPETELADKALALAREFDDPELFAFVGRNYLHGVSTPGNLEHRIALARELEEVGRTLDNPVARWDALPVQPAWEAGLLDWVDRNDAEGRQVLEGVPFALGHVVNLQHRVKRALFSGEVRNAQRWLDEQAEIGGWPFARQLLRFSQAHLRLAQGRAEELLPLVERLPAGSFYRAFTASVLLECGRVEGAAALLRDESDAGMEFLSNELWYATAVTWADIAAEVGDARAAVQLEERLLPYADRLANHVLIAGGSIARQLGRLETTLGRYDEASGHLAHAERRHQEWGAKLFLAQTWGDQAELMLRRDGDGARQSAHELLERARTVAEECEAPGIERYLDRIIARSSGGGLSDV